MFNKSRSCVPAFQTVSVRTVSGGDLCEAEAHIEPAGETKDASEMGAQSVGRDLISGSLVTEVIKSCVGELVSAF